LQAAVKASREGQTTVKLKHFEWAKGELNILRSTVEHVKKLTI
jgi:hypothetical protein